MSYLLYVTLLLGAVRARDPFWYPGHEGRAAVTSPSVPELLAAVREGRTLVAHFAPPPSDDPTDVHMEKVNAIMLQVVAQALQNRNVSVVCVKTADNQEAAKLQQGIVADSVVVYKQGEQFLYSGHRSAEPLIAFINKLDLPVVSIIQTKQEKKVFERVAASKVVGYFQAWPTNPEMMAFEAAAKVHYPHVQFSAVITKEMALMMQFTDLGEVHVIHPFEKKPQILQQNPATEADITNFLRAYGRPSMQRVTMEDLHNIWGSAEEARVVAFARHLCPASNSLFKAFKSMAKFGLLRNTTSKTILFIDPDDFPTLVEHWQTTFGINLTNPALGLLNITDNTASWADLSDFSAMNATDQIAFLSLWLDAVTAGRVRVDGLPAAPSQAHLESVASEAATMALRAAEAAQAAAQAAEAAAQAAAAASKSSPHSEESSSEGQTAAKTTNTPNDGATVAGAGTDEL